MSLVVTGVRSGLFFDKVRFQANCYHECVFGSMLGDKVFYLNQGDAITIRRSKDDMYQVGQLIDHLGSLITMSNQTKFPWFWRT